MELDFDYGEWRELPLRPEVRVAAPDDLTRNNTVLGAARELTVLSADLRECFEVARPGSYRLRVVFQVPWKPEGRSNEVTFSIAAPTGGER